MPIQRSLSHPPTTMFESIHAVLVDFDGPVCSVFAGCPAPTITEQMLTLVNGVPRRLVDQLHRATGPHELLALAAHLAPRLTDALEFHLQTAETHAVATATPTKGAHDFMYACRQAGYRVAMVSNNTSQCITRYLEHHHLTDLVAHVQGRDPHDPHLMKPHPHLLITTLNQLGLKPSQAVMIGDQPSDITAAHSAGVGGIGFARTAERHARLVEAEADYVIDAWEELTCQFRRRVTSQ